MVIMKRTSTLLISCSLIIIVTLVAVLGWYGYFSSVTTQEKPIGPFLIVYKKHVGSVDRAAITSQMRRFLSAGLPESSLTDFSLDYDDPKQVAAEDRRSLVGCVLEYGQEADLHAISKQYTIATIPRGMAVVCDYPYKNKPSLFFGLLKGYSALLGHGDTPGLVTKPVLALYDTSRGRIRYALFTAFEPSFFEAYLLLE